MDQEFKYNREFPSVSFNIFFGDTHKIDIHVTYINHEYEIFFNSDNTVESLDNSSKSNNIIVKYKLYTNNVDKVSNFIMSYLDQRYNKIVSIHFSLWTPPTGEDEMKNELFTIYMNNKNYSPSKDHIEDQVKRMIHLCTDLYMTEYTHKREEK
jgi:hypothetical protein